MNKYDEEKYEWKGFNIRMGKSYSFHIKPKKYRFANCVELHFLWFKVGFNWIWSYRKIWSDGWDAHFRQSHGIGMSDLRELAPGEHKEADE